MTTAGPEFDEIPTVRLGRASDRRRTVAGVIVATLAIFIAIAKPWGDPPGQLSVDRSASPAPTTRSGPRDPDVPLLYDPRLFGAYVIRPAWELWPAGYVYQFGISGPLTLDDAVRPSPTGPRASDAGGTPPTAVPRPSPPPAQPPPEAGELVDLGAADHLVVLALNTPADTRILAARLWWFPAEGPPERVGLAELPPPWPVDYFHVYGRPSRDPTRLSDWQPGIYRLDLIVDPGVSVRRIGVLVRPPLDDPDPTASPPDPASPGSGSPRDPADLGDEIRPGTIGFAGPAIDSWVFDAPGAQRSCGLAELWLAEADRPGGHCSAIVVQGASAIALDLGPDRPIRAVELDQIDPLAVPVELVPSDLPGDGGIAVRTRDGSVLPDGTYRLTVTLADGERVAWYLRVP